MTPIKVLYILAMGRSGSTLLGNTLGQIEGFCDVGELRHLWGNGLRWNSPCGCGELVTQCSFWMSVTANAIEGDRDLVAARLVELQKTKVKTSKAPRLLAHLVGFRSHDYDEYAAALEAHYRAIAQESGAAVVVDGSKHPIDALLLSKVPGVELHVLHLVRDPRGVAYSWSKRKENPGTKRGFMLTRTPTASSIRWSIRVLLAGVIRISCSDRFMQLRYEDFVRQPAEALRQVLSWIGEDRPQIPITGPPNKVVLGPTHTAWGNPNRHLRGEIAIVPDEEWRRAMPRKAYVFATLPTLPLLWILGYRVFRRSSPE